jgi:hypothetical protein
MKKRGSPVRYIGFAILALIAWYHLPHLSHGCHEKNCTVFSSAKEGEKALIAKEPVEAVLNEIGFELPLSVNFAEDKEGNKELFRVTLRQARAPPYPSIFNM